MACRFDGTATIAAVVTLDKTGADGSVTTIFHGFGRGQDGIKICFLGIQTPVGIGVRAVDAYDRLRG